MRASLLLVAVAALALTAARQAPSVPLLLTPANFDAALLLPPPPADDSAVEREELAALHRMDASRSAEAVAHAKADGDTKSLAIFAAVMGPGFDPGKLPATDALFDTVHANEKAVVAAAKAHFHRNRPWIVDPTLNPCSKNDDPQSSYPSGHTSSAYAVAGVLVRLVPAKAPAILARAADYAHSRIVCEVHFPGDVSSGQAFGTMIAERLMEQPAFRAQFAAASAELSAAHPAE
jgi:acid phosphatase (class A)